MRKGVSTLLIAGVFLLAGCAGSGGLGPLSSGRYMQMTHPATGTVAFQMTFPNADSCALAMQGSTDSLLRRLTACRADSVAATLPFRAVARNDIYNFLLELDAITKEECEAFLESALRAPGTKATVVSPCARK